MRAMQIVELNQPLVMREVDRPSAGAGEVLLRVLACGINFADTLQVAGSYQEKHPLPYAPGMEICGVIEQIGVGVDGLAVGERVVCMAGKGGLQEYVAVPAQACLPVPASMPDEVAAGFLIAYGTSHLALHRRARLQPGENLLVLGAAGGVGLTAVEIGKLMGACVIACARGAAKLEIARAAGADHLLDSATANIRDEVRSLGGADVIYDPVGGEQFQAALRATNPEGRLLPLGFASGEVPQIPANILLVKNLTVIGVYWGGYQRFNPAAMTDSIRQLLAWYEQGRLRPHVSHFLPLEQANQALDLLRLRKSTGKVVVRVA